MSTKHRSSALRRAIARANACHAAFGVAALCAAASAAVLWGRDAPSGDQMVVATLAMRDVRPEWFAGDPFMESAASRFYLPWLRRWIALFVRLGWRPSAGFAVMHAVTATVYVAGMCAFLGRVARSSPGTAAALALASAVAHPALGGTWYGVWPAATAGARSAWLAAMPWVATALWIHPARRAPWLFAGLIAYLHPLSGVAFLVLWTTAALVARPPPDRPRPDQIGFALLGLAPVLAGMLFLPGSSPASAQAYGEALRMRLGYLLFPYPAFGAVLFLAGLLPWIVMAVCARNAPATNAGRRFFLVFAVAALVLPAATAAAAQGASAVLGVRNLAHDALRAVRFVYFPLAALAAAPASFAAARRRALWCMAAAAAFIPTEQVARMARAGAREMPEGRDPGFRELCDWASRATPPGTVFAVPSNAFRYHARRPITGCTEDGGTLILAGTEELHRWIEEEKTRRSILERRDAAAWIAHAAERNAAYAVFPAAWPGADAEAVFANAAYRVVAPAPEIKQPPGVTVPPDADPQLPPEGFMLTMTAPGCDPGEDCDDVGPKLSHRLWYIDRTGCNVGQTRISWRESEKRDPATGRVHYDFSGVTLSERDARMPFIRCAIDSGGPRWITDPGHGIGPAWREAEDFKFTVDEDGRKRVSDEYWRAFEEFVEAGCRYVHGKWGITIFTTGGNERDLIARATYRDFYPDWHFYYMAPILPIHAGMKRAIPGAKLMVGNFCYTTADHVGALYDAGGQGRFELFGIHAYGKMGVHVDMRQIITARNELARRGDGHIGIVLTEGWSCFPLPDRIDKDPVLRRGARVYTDEDAEHYRQTVLDGWRNLMTPREGEYDPRWVVGTTYFVLNDHWGGRGWEERATPEYDEHGNLRGFHLDGYWMGTSDYDWIKPFLRPWGLITIDGRPKGDIVFNFPPYLPKHDYRIVFDEELPGSRLAAGREYRFTVTFTNDEAEPMTDFRMEMIGRDDEARRVRYRFLGGHDTRDVQPGQTVVRRYAAVYPPGLVGADPWNARGYADANYTWKGRPYHTDAWMPRVEIVQPLTFRLGEGERTAEGPAGSIAFAVDIASSFGTALPTRVRIEAPPEIRVEPVETVVDVPAGGRASPVFGGRLTDPGKTGIYELGIHVGEGLEPIVVPVAFPRGAGRPQEGFGLRNPSFEDVGADSGYAHWEGGKTNWIHNDEAKSLPGGGERAFGAASDWLTFDYTIAQAVDLPGDAVGKRIRSSVWFIGRGWDADASGEDVVGAMNLVFLDRRGGELARRNGPETKGTGEWRRIALTSDPVPPGAAQVRLELRLASHRAVGCRRGAMDMVRLEIRGPT